MTEIFRLEYHPQGGAPRRIRFLTIAKSDDIQIVAEERDGRSWTRVGIQTVDYFEYSGQ